MRNRWGAVSGVSLDIIINAADLWYELVAER